MGEMEQAEVDAFLSLTLNSRSPSPRMRLPTRSKRPLANHPRKKKKQGGYLPILLLERRNSMPMPFAAGESLYYQVIGQRRAVDPLWQSVRRRISHPSFFLTCQRDRLLYS